MKINYVTDVLQKHFTTQVHKFALSVLECLLKDTETSLFYKKILTWSHKNVVLFLFLFFFLKALFYMLLLLDFISLVEEITTVTC